MKRSILGMMICLSSMSVFAENISAQSIVKWQANAVKDTSSALVVTPLSSLNFQYAEGTKSFNAQNGQFDVTIQGINGSTDFKLLSKVISNELIRADDHSKLNVTAKWNGKELSKSNDTILIDSGNGIRSGLSALADKDVYGSSNRNSAQGSFNFDIKNAVNAEGNNTKFENLKDGRWSGEVAVQFTAIWTQ